MRAGCLDRAKALPHRRARAGFAAVFICNDFQAVVKFKKQLAGSKKKIRIARSAQFLITRAEGVDEQYTARGE